MRLNVPFFTQTTAHNCGQTVLRMVLAYFDKDPGINILEQNTKIGDSKAVSTKQIAIAASRMGYKVNFLSKYLLYNPKSTRLKYYKERKIDLRNAELYLEEARKSGVNIKEKSIALNELLSYVSKASIPIILLDWNIIKQNKNG